MACCVFVFTYVRESLYVEGKCELFDVPVSVKVPSDSIRFNWHHTQFCLIVKRDEFNFRTTAVSSRFIGGKLTYYLLGSSNDAPAGLISTARL